MVFGLCPHTSEDILQFLCWQKGMASAIAGMRLGEPTGDTLFGKTVRKQLSILLIECAVVQVTRVTLL